MAAEEFTAEGLVSYREIARMEGLEPTYPVSLEGVAMAATVSFDHGPFKTPSGEII